MTAKNRFDDSNMSLGREERMMALAKMSLEQLLYYVLVDLRPGKPGTAVA